MNLFHFSSLFTSAVVGAGIGGSATAHFLRQHFGPEVQVDVFEKSEVGGRLATVTVNHNDYESGGSIIHSLNLHMQEFVKQLGKLSVIIFVFILYLCALSFVDPYLH